jgi:hypothetical protein
MGSGREGDPVPDGLACGPRLLARDGDRRYLLSFSACSLRLAAEDVALSRRKQGFESPRERQ